MFRLCCVALWMAAAISVTIALRCTSDQFTCADGSQCINATSYCDGYLDCRDRSDEPLTIAKLKSFCVGDRCDLKADLATSYRSNCSKTGVDLQCRSHEFPCADGSQCLPGTSFCDGFRNCRDESDEVLRHISIKYEANQTFCRGFNGHICALRADLATRFKRYCSKPGVDLQCRSDEFPCTDGSLCLPGHSFCDGSRDCRDGSDEPLRNISIKYDANQAFCRGKWGHICVLRADLAIFLKSYCSMSGVDVQCRSDEFLCADGSHCLPANIFCDGSHTCRDGSDEIRHYSRHFQHNSGGNSCLNIHTSRICMLPTGVDPKKVEFCQTNYLGKYRFGCLSRPTVIIPKSNVCNGKFDCPDRSDECLCSSTRRELCQSATSADETTPFEDVEEDRYYQCPYQRAKAAIKCDGIPECLDFFKEECNCAEIPEFCTSVTIHTIRHRNVSYDVQRPSASCGASSYFFQGDIICNGVVDCTKNDTDERGCEASRFYCTEYPVPNIPLVQICDGNDDCPNGADERGNGRHFCCSDNGILNYILRSKVCDGIQDCKLGSDECQNCINSAFSDDSSLISSKALQAFVWIINTMALVGCVLVVTFAARDLIRPKEEVGGIELTGHTKLITMLILNFFVSNILVVVYALIICIKALELNENYCLVDKSWRSDNTCSALGTIFMIGSEQSVFTLVLIASQRLHAVLRPVARPNILCAIVALIASWLISIILALVPLIPRLEDYFVSSIMFSENEIFKVIHNNDTDYMIDWLSLMYENMTIGDDVGVTNWSKIRNLTAQVNPNITVKYEFGYYSSHTVCLPPFFPDREMANNWGYTLFILLINVFAFLFIMACFVISYRHISKSMVEEQSSENHQKVDEQNAKMQRKFTRIVVTDFFFWMPIYIMGFLQISGVEIPRDAYLPVGLIIAPINIALNPFLYSDLPEILMKKLGLNCPRLKQPAENPHDHVEMLLSTDS